MNKLAGPAILFLYLAGATMTAAALENSPGLAPIYRWPALTAALALLVLPWTTHPRSRAAAAILVGFATISRAYALAIVGEITGALLWVTVLAGAIAAIGNDQDQPLSDKLPDNYK